MNAKIEINFMPNEKNKRDLRKCVARELQMYPACFCFWRMQGFQLQPVYNLSLFLLHLHFTLVACCSVCVHRFLFLARPIPPLRNLRKYQFPNTRCKTTPIDAKESSTRTLTMSITVERCCTPARLKPLKAALKNCITREMPYRCGGARVSICPSNAAPRRIKCK